jgi:DNA-binding Xre family transcriptional regulator
MPIEWRLAYWLEKRGMTAYQLAQAMGVKHATVYRLAKRETVTRIRGDTLAAICATLKVTPGQLMRVRD